MTRYTVVNTASKNSSITVTQRSIVGYLEHSSTIGEESSLEISISHSNPRAVSKVPVRRSKGIVTGGTVDVNPPIVIVIIIVVCVSGYPVLAIAIVTKVCYQWIIPYSRVKMVKQVTESSADSYSM